MLLNDLKKNNISFFPVKSDGSKAPACKKWGHYQKSFPTDGEIEKWRQTFTSFALVCGKASGNVEVFDFDDKHKHGIYEKWYEMLPGELKELVDTLPKSTTPSGGAHIYYRCSDINGNRNDFCKGEVDIAGGKEVRAFIETRGDGGYVIMPPSPGYQLERGDLKDIPEITPEERQMLFMVAQQLSEVSPTEKYTTPVSVKTDTDRPGDDFGQKAAWEEILTPHGWRVVYEQGGVRYWCRPGKKKGTSATENYANTGLLHIFSTSTPFEPEKSYTKFQAYAILDYQSDFKQAAKDLSQKGYGGKKGETAKEEIAKTPEEGDENPFYITMADSIDPKPIEWLWDGKIAKGKITLIAGNPGLGKSQATLSIAAMETNKTNFPANLQKGSGGHAILLSAEDDISDTIVPRLIAAGADRSKVHLLSMTRDKDNQGNEHRRSFDLTRDTEKLGDYIKRVGNITLVVIDPISAFLGETDSNNNAEVRARLHELSAIAERYKVAVIGVTHLNKKDTTNAISRFMGSTGFIAHARAAYAVTKDENSEDGRVLFTPAKNNLAVDTTGLAFTVENSSIPSGADPIETSRVVWEQREIEVNSDQALGGGKESKKEMSPEQQEAKEWLIYLLREYPDGMDGKEVKKMAKAAGISDRTLYRVVGIMGQQDDGDGIITREPQGFGKPHIWKYNNI